MFSSGGTLSIFFFTQMCTKMLVNICSKFSENMLTNFLFLDFASNLHQLGQSIHKRPGSNKG